MIKILGGSAKYIQAILAVVIKTQLKTLKSLDWEFTFILKF